MAITETVKLVLAVVVGCVLLFGAQKVLEWREAAVQNDQRGRTLTATSGITKDGDQADNQRTSFDNVVSGARNDFNTAIDEGYRNEPETAARADRVVPASVRNAFRERRLARERLGCVGEQCQSRPSTKDAAERP